VSEIESYVREGLRHLAEEVDVHLQVPQSVRRRARRRRLRTALLAGAITAGLLASAVVGIRSLTGTTPRSSMLRPGESVSTPGLPTQFEEKRLAILEAAQNHDWAGLHRLIPDRGFAYSIGDSIGGGFAAIAFWRDLERAGEPVLSTLITLLEGPWAVDRSGHGPGVAIIYRGEVIHQSPAASTKDPAKWTAEDLKQLRQIATEREIHDYLKKGYSGWVIGIAADGTWRFYIVGD
jgi:hypothetical protein